MYDFLLKECAINGQIEVSNGGDILYVSDKLADELGWEITRGYEFILMSENGEWCGIDNAKELAYEDANNEFYEFYVLNN